MFKYLLKRITIFIPTLIAITLVAFTISLNAPGDPVLQMMTGGPSSASSMDAEQANSEKEYLLKRKELGLDLPVFYFALSTFAHSDTLFKIPRLDEQEMLGRLTDRYGNWPEISEYYHSLIETERTVLELPPNTVRGEQLLRIKNDLITLRKEDKAENIYFFLGRVDSLVSKVPEMATLAISVRNSESSFKNVEQNATRWKTYIPSFHFYGIQNQYHRWITAILFDFDFGTSYQDHREIRKVLPERLKWTLIISLFSILLAYGISIPLGVMSARYKDSLFDKISTSVVFILFSLLNFWVAANGKARSSYRSRFLRPKAR